MIEHIDKNKASLQVKDRFDFQGFLGNRYDSVYHFIKKIKKSIDKAICCMIYLLSNRDGVLAQLGEHLLCTQGVIGSIPIRSTMIDQKRFLTESFFVLCLGM